MAKPQSDALQGAMAAFAPKLAALLRGHGLSQPELGRQLKRRGQGVSTKTLNNIVNTQHSTQIGNLAAVADYFGVPLWVMLIPELPQDMVDGDGLKRLDKLIRDYVACDPVNRKHAENIAAAYAQQKVK